jgi:hypothetical protein
LAFKLIWIIEPSLISEAFVKTIFMIVAVWASPIAKWNEPGNRWTVSPTACGFFVSDAGPLRENGGHEESVSGSMLSR